MRSSAFVCSLALVLATPTAGADPVRDLEEREPRTVLAQADPTRREGTAAPTPTPGSEVAPQVPVYRLPAVGKPRRRVGGGRRGVSDAGPALHALVPEHVGLTTSAAPTLYWVLDAPAVPGARFELTLSDERAIEPLVEMAIAGPLAPGLQRVRLADYGIALEIGTEYQWAVAIVVNPEERSTDVVTAGWIERVADPGGAPADVAEAAGRGLWYDALDLACANAGRSA